ncbi:MAG TPA: hypothetical protein VMF03_16035 [Steroidobacteraceae bacterium]|nr:hypothetical protein [Steroidobacteraceae bacterium]
MTTDLERSALSGMSVLVVEDEYYVATEMAEQIERVGGSVIGPFATSDEAFAELTHSAPDCALLDINTGSGPSFELADALLAQGVPFAFLTGYDGGSVPQRFSAVERVQKPAQSRTVIAALSKLRAH